MTVQTRRTLLGILSISLLLAGTGEAQVGRILGRAAADEARRNMERLMREGVRCVFNDLECVRRAEAEGKPVVLTDRQGEVLLDREGNAITDPSQAAAAQDTEKPGEGAWANYDFVPGEQVLFAEDFSDDDVGDFPRRLELKGGNWEVVEWQGRRLLRNTGPRYSAVEIPLDQALPERFTIELDVYLAHPTYQLAVATTTPERSVTRVGANYVMIGRGGTGLAFGGPKGKGIESRVVDKRVYESVTPVRIMVDGTHVKVYVNERRVANVPKAEVPRGRVVHLQNTYAASERAPLLIGSIRIAAGGRELYDALEARGRVATTGIYFATDGDRIQPESTPTLEAIAEMLTSHPELALTIEGHTDSQGEEAYNQDLSERRAAAVKTYLVERHGIAADRLVTTGFGESRPAMSNDTSEGRQQNRRVELVKRGG